MQEIAPSTDTISEHLDAMPQPAVFDEAEASLAEFAAMPLDHGGDLQEVLNRYNNGEQIACPYIRQMGNAGIRLVEKLAEIQRKVVDRKTTASDVISQSTAAGVKTSVVDKTSLRATREIARERVDGQIYRQELQLRQSLEVARRLSEETFTPIAQTETTSKHEVAGLSPEINSSSPVMQLVDNYPYMHPRPEELRPSVQDVALEPESDALPSEEYDLKSIDLELDSKVEVELMTSVEGEVVLPTHPAVYQVIQETTEVSFEPHELELASSEDIDTLGAVTAEIKTDVLEPETQSVETAEVTSFMDMAREIVEAYLETVDISEFLLDSGEIDTIAVEALFIELVESLEFDIEAKELRNIVRGLLDEDLLARIPSELKLSIDQLNHLGTREYLAQLASRIFSTLSQLDSTLEHQTLGTLVLSVSLS